MAFIFLSFSLPPKVSPLFKYIQLISNEPGVSGGDVVFHGSSSFDHDAMAIGSLVMCWVPRV